MSEEKSASKSRKALREQLAFVDQLRELPFDDLKYEDWRLETAKILDQVFGRAGSEQHPCTTAFLDYRIPEHFTATHAEMQEYYRNILQTQADLLKMYLAEI